MRRCFHSANAFAWTESRARCTIRNAACARRKISCVCSRQLSKAAAVCRCAQRSHTAAICFLRRVKSTQLSHAAFTHLCLKFTIARRPIVAFRRCADACRIHSSQAMASCDERRRAAALTPTARRRTFSTVYRLQPLNADARQYPSSFRASRAASATRRDCRVTNTDHDATALASTLERTRCTIRNAARARRKFSCVCSRQPPMAATVCRCAQRSHTAAICFLRRVKSTQLSHAAFTHLCLKFTIARRPIVAFRRCADACRIHSSQAMASCDERRRAAALTPTARRRTFSTVYRLQPLNADARQYPSSFRASRAASATRRDCRVTNTDHDATALASTLERTRARSRRVAVTSRSFSSMSVQRRRTLSRSCPRPWRRDRSCC